MTATADHHTREGSVDVVVPVTVEVDGVPMSGLLARAPRPRGVIVAVHGGSTTAAYFDAPGDPWRSLLRLGAAVGFTVLGLDRPGYGRSAPHAHTMVDPQVRVDLAYGAIDAHLAGLPRGAGVFLLAHSAGCDLVMRMAADPRGTQLLGIELAGTGRRHPPLARALLDITYREKAPAAVRGLLWQPSHVYPPGVGGGSIGVPAPAYERSVVEDWAEHELPRLAAEVRVPVHFSLGEYELVWQSGPAALADIAGLFRASPRVVVNEQSDSGHNLSLGYTATAYHLTILSFIEECVIARSDLGKKEN
jgi:pimeloyl-ACP methyl ester carboxylesterase